MTDNILKALIRKTETGKTAPAEQYGTIIGHNEGKLAKPLVEFTVGGIIAASDGWRKRFGTTSGAAGAYQIIKPTLSSLVSALAIDRAEKFTPELQDRFADRLLAARGINRFLTGDLTVEEFGNALAREWASFPVLSTQKRGETVLKRGQSYYDKVAGNSALIKPETVEATLMMLRKGDAPAPVPVPTYQPGDSDEPTPVSSTGLTFGDWIVALAVGLAVAAIATLTIWLL